jgi:hypothetical protein
MLLPVRARSSLLWCEAWLKYCLSELQLGHVWTGGFLCIFGLNSWLSTSSQKSSPLSLLLGSFLGLQRDLWLFTIVLLCILHLLYFLLSDLSCNICGLDWLLNWSLWNWLKTIDFDWVSVLDQDDLLVVSWDNLTVWKCLRVMIHQKDVLLEWVNSLESHHCSLLSWVHYHLWHRCWHSAFNLLLLKYSLFLAKAILIASMSNIMKIELILGCITMKVAIGVELLLII